MGAGIQTSIRNSWALWLMVISLIILIIFTWLPATNEITHGFAAYYASSRLILDHRGGALLYDDGVFRADVEALTEGRASDIYWANPPTTALLFLLLAKLLINDARYVWMLVSLIAVLLALSLSGLVISKFPLYTNAFYIASSLFLLSTPLAENFRFGQAYAVILAFYIFALYAAYFGYDRLAGFWLGLVLTLKGSGIPLLILLLFRGKWQVVIGAFLTSAALALISLPLIGVAAWRIYLFDVVPRFLADPVITMTAYQTVPGFIQHLFAYHPIWNTAPIVDLPVVALVANKLTGLMLVAIAVIHSRRATLEWTFCVGLVLSVILIPAAEQHHYVLLFPAFLLGAHSTQVPKVPLYISAALVALPLDYMTRALTTGCWALFAYPRLYGAIILLIILHLHGKDAKLCASSEANKLDAAAGVQ